MEVWLGRVPRGGWEKSVEDHPSWREDLWETLRNRTENKKQQKAMGMSQPAEDLGIIRKVIVSHFWLSKRVAAAVARPKSLNETQKGLD